MVSNSLIRFNCSSSTRGAFGGSYDVSSLLFEIFGAKNELFFKKLLSSMSISAGKRSTSLITVVSIFILPLKKGSSGSMLASMIF